VTMGPGNTPFTQAHVTSSGLRRLRPSTDGAEVHRSQRSPQIAQSTQKVVACPFSLVFIGVICGLFSPGAASATEVVTKSTASRYTVSTMIWAAVTFRPADRKILLAALSRTVQNREPGHGKHRHKDSK